MCFSGMPSCGPSVLFGHWTYLVCALLGLDDIFLILIIKMSFLRGGRFDRGARPFGRD
jgi:hypothetical protein